MSRMIGFLPLVFVGLAQAQTAGSSWSLPKKPQNPAHTAQAHVLLGSPTARLVRVCYLIGPDGSSVAVRANASGGPNQASNIYKGSCLDIGGTDVEITNPNDVPVSGSYLLLPQADKQTTSL